MELVILQGRKIRWKKNPQHFKECSQASQVALVVKNLPANPGEVEMRVQTLGGEDPLVEGMGTHSSSFAWRTPWTEEPGGQQTVHRFLWKESDTT